MMKGVCTLHKKTQDFEKERHSVLLLHGVWDDDSEYSMIGIRIQKIQP